MGDLERLGFNLVGYGCTTCIGNSGPLPEPVAKAIESGDLVAVAVLSGNRNFEGRVNPLTRANYLASPPLVVAYALAGTMDFDPATEPIGSDTQGKPVLLRDVWPTPAEVNTALKAVSAERFREEYGRVFDGDAHWQQMPVPTGDLYAWDANVDVHPVAAVLRRDDPPAGARAGRARRARPGAARRLHHHRPHLARRLDQAGQSRRPVPRRSRRAAEGLQLLRRAARQPRGDDAGHVRQHPAEEPPGAGRGGRRHGARAVGRAHVDLRRGHALPAGRRAAGGDRGQGVRHRVVA